jgi:hypothetical protein
MIAPARFSEAGRIQEFQRRCPPATGSSIDKEVTALAGCLGPVHRQIGAMDDRLGRRHKPELRKKADANAGTELRVDRQSGNRLLNQRDDLFGKMRRTVAGTNVLNKQEELVTPKREIVSVSRMDAANRRATSRRATSPFSCPS